MTWGEVKEYIRIKWEQDRRADQRIARILYTTLGLMTQSFSGKNQEVDFSFMHNYDYLFTIEEQREAKKQRLYDMLEGKK